MAHFSNGTQFMMWQDSNCDRCLHDAETCPILTLHDAYNVFQFKDATARKVLDMLIPADSGFVEQCSMFLERKEPL